ncbi:VOC family protein [Achromobacter aloeverae]|uniref:VOC family protein n=1 Tax=Achromobacter aloeverae TaxID=1750518 RepID=A0A4Q1HET9_9BURK|nr:VOC family protein [Achromobacter aloeverae]RXN85173.1 VOC family protein [Achromobacter aloeverae]
MPSLPLSLDHTGLIIRDLETARAAFEKLGFRLSSRSMHAGSITPGGPVEPWGSGNHCAMFKHGYFELLGLVDPTLYSTAKQMIARYEGLHIVAMDCASADEAHRRLQEQGIPAAAPARLERDAAYGPHDEETRRARFSNVYLDGEQCPEARFIVIEHGTRDVLWQPHLLSHPNGATGLAAIYFCPTDLPATLARFERLLGAPTRHGDAYCFALVRGVFWVLSPQAMRAACPVLASPADDAIHRVSAACIEVASLPALRGLLRERGIDTFEAPTLDGGRPSLWVHPSQTSHAALQFIEAS